MSNLQWLCRYPCHADKTEREAAEAQGYKVKVPISDDGWPVVCSSCRAEMEADTDWYEDQEEGVWRHKDDE